MVSQRVLVLVGLFLFCTVAHGEEDQQAEVVAAPADMGAENANTKTQSPVESPATADAFPLPNIIVVGERRSAPPSVIVRDATEADFVEWNVRTAAGALARTPGVSVQIGGSSGDASPWIRGFRDRDILILFDGIPIGSALEGSLDLNEISLNSISKTRVMKGAPSVIYGANGLGGVIDVIPRSSDRFDAKGAAVEIAENGGESYRGHVGSSAGALNYFITAGYEAADDYALSSDYEPEPNQPSEDRINSDFERITATLLLNSEGSFLGNTSLFLNMSDIERGITPRSTGDDPDFERLTESQRLTVGLSNQFESLPMSLKAYYNQYDSEVTVYTDETYSTIDEIDTGEDYSIGLAVYGYVPTWDTGTLVLSGSWARDVFEAEGVFDDFDRAELNTVTLSAEHETVLYDQLSLAVGLIYTHVDQPAVDRGIDELSPQIALGYKFGGKVSLHASAAQRTRFPKLREFYRRRWGNPELIEQSADNFEIGGAYQHNERLTTDLTIFRSEIDGLIDRPTRRSIYENLDSITSEGIELASGGWWTDSLHFRVSYAYVDIAEELPDGTERQLRSRPKHQGFADFRFRWTDSLTISLNALYVSELYDLDDDQVHRRLPTFTVFDARVSKSFQNGFSAYAAVSNLTDKDYILRVGDPQPGRAFRIGVTFGD